MTTEAATPETEVAESSTPVTPASTPQPESESQEPQLEVTPSVESGEETHEEAGEAEKPAPKPLEQWSLQELNDKAYKDGLSADETRRRDQLQQSYNDQVTAYRQRVQEQEREEQTRLQELQNLGNTVRANIATAIQSEVQAALQAGRDPDLKLIEDRVSRQMEDYDQKTGEKHLAPYENALGKLLLTDGIYGDTPQNRKAVQQMDLSQRITMLAQRMRDLGKMEGPGPDYVVKPKKDYDKELADAAKKAVDDFKAANPGSAPPTATGGRSTGGLTLDSWHSMSFEDREEYRREHPEEVNAMTRQLAGR